MLTTEEIKEKIIEQIDEVDLIDLLGLTTEDLVEAFEDKIIEKEQKIIRELDLPIEDDNENDQGRSLIMAIFWDLDINLPPINLYNFKLKRKFYMDKSQKILSDITVFNKYAKHYPELGRRVVS